MEDAGVPDHFVELREVAVVEPAVVDAPAAPAPARSPVVAVVREELVLRRRRVTARQPANELGRGEVRIGVVRETGHPYEAAI
jgi:hypothetical protein